MLLTSSTKAIDDSLKNLVAEIEAQSSNISVLAARQFCYHLRQNIVELKIQEPRQFNVLEEFIIRAGIEFDPPPTGDELASILGLDPIFVHSTIKNLQNLQTLVVKSQIIVTAEGRSFYERGTVLQSPYPIQIYAITDPLQGQITFLYQSFSEENPINIPDGLLINFSQKNTDISKLQLEEIQQILQNTDLELHKPETCKIVTDFRLLPQTQLVIKAASIFILFDAFSNKFSIQIRQGKQILEFNSNILVIIADQLWAIVLKNQDTQLAIEPLCIWAALGMEDFALTAIQEKNYLELLPLWLNIVIPGIKSKTFPDDSTSLAAALSLLNQISGEEDFVEALKVGLCGVVAAIATHNTPHALKLLNNEVWAQFMRLNIAPESDSPEQFISQYITPLNQSQETKGKTRKRKTS
jgi:hypothetical protein